jgi:hypothetical protein
MPEISRFFGIVVFLNYNDHPPPHFHARHAGENGRVGIDPVEVLEGDLSPKARRRLLRWATAHRAELLADWDRVRAGKPPLPIAPLTE